MQATEAWKLYISRGEVLACVYEGRPYLKHVEQGEREEYDYDKEGEGGEHYSAAAGGRARLGDALDLVLSHLVLQETWGAAERV